MNSTERHADTAAQGFAATRWSVVLDAARTASSETSERALEELCRAYWPPLYAFLRRNGHAPRDAQDLTQSFFAALLRKNFLKQVHPEKGRFRSFLLAALKHFAANERDKALALKRGGGIQFESLHVDEVETRYCRAPAEHLSPDRLFERAWALTLLDRVLDRLRSDYAATGKSALFESLKDSVFGGKSSEPYASIARKLGMSEGSVKVAAHRLRQRCREVLLQEIASTVGSPSEVDAELKHLFAVIADL